MKKQLTKLRYRNLKLDLKVLKIVTKKLDEEKMKKIENKNTKLLTRLKEEVLRRIILETEIEHLKNDWETR